MERNWFLFILFAISVILTLVGIALVIIYANFAAFFFGLIIAFFGAFLMALFLWEIVFDAVKKARE